MCVVPKSMDGAPDLLHSPAAPLCWRLLTLPISIVLSYRLSWFLSQMGVRSDNDAAVSLEEIVTPNLRHSLEIGRVSK